MKKPKAAERGLEQTLARAGDGVFAIGPEGRVVLWNRAAEKILGWSAREVMGRPCCDVFVGVGRPRQPPLLQGLPRHEPGQARRAGPALRHADADQGGHAPCGSTSASSRRRRAAPAGRWRSTSSATSPPRGSCCASSTSGFRRPRPRPTETTTAHAPRARSPAPHGGRRQHQGAGRAPPRQPRDHPQPRPEHLRQARRPQPARGRGLCDASITLLLARPRWKAPSTKPP